MALNSLRPTYTGPALIKYLDHIRLPGSFMRNLPLDPLHPHSASLSIAPASHSTMQQWGASSAGFTFLQALQLHQLCKIPFANLHLHYSTHKKGTLDAGLQYEYLINSSGLASDESFYAVPSTASTTPTWQSTSILTPPPSRQVTPSIPAVGSKWSGRIASGGRGATCTMNNGFFGTVMRSFGMNVKTTGARVALSFGDPGGRREGFGGWNHQINLVNFTGKTWLVDVGFGGQGPTAPMELRDGYEQSQGSTPDSNRLRYMNLAEHEHAASKCWVLQHKKQGQEWIDCYAFTTEEFLPMDLAVMTFKTTQDTRGSFFNQMVICTRFLMQDRLGMGGELKGQIVGTVGMVNGKVKKRVYKLEGMSGRWIEQDVKMCKTEVERWDALESEFGIVLGEQERMGIKGLGTELKSIDNDDGAFLDAIHR